MLKILPHPNLLKVKHSYLWFLMMLINLIVYFFYSKVILSVLIFIFSFIVVIISISIFQRKFLKMEYVFIKKSETCTYKQFFIQTDNFRFKRDYLERAYGLYHLKIGKHCLRGIDENDRRRIENWSKDVTC